MAGVAVLAVTGCSQSPYTVRGQSPAVPPGSPAVPGAAVAPPLTDDPAAPIIGTAPGYGETFQHPKKRHDFKHFRNYYNYQFNPGNGWYSGVEDNYPNHQKRVYDVASTGCPACQGGACYPEGGCPHCGCGCGHSCPDHYQTYSYKWPKNLVYPPPVLPAGMVQYPYYTLRGPTDFFMK
jgi:hypothetical protein